MNKWRKLEKKINSLITEKKFMAIEWKIQVNGKTVSKGISHSKTAQLQLQVSDFPIYRIYSMTKPIISLAVAMAFEQKKLQFKEPLIKYLPEFKNARVKLNSGLFEPLRRSITILDLLTHNAGLSYGFNRSCQIGRMYKNDKLIRKN